MTDESFARLTDDQRPRLRRSVDPEALERLLARVPKGERALVLLGFYTDPTAVETMDALRGAGISETEIDELRPFAEYAPLPPHLAHPESDPDPDWVAPTWPVQLSLQPLGDQELRMLWEAVEPSRGAA
jgi:hypothetical protein